MFYNKLKMNEVDGKPVRIPDPFELVIIFA